MELRTEFSLVSFNTAVTLALLTYLKQFVAGEEIGRRLENCGHGFGQFFMHCLIFGSNIRLSLIRVL